MARLALGDHLPGGHVQRCEQGCGAVTDVVVGDALDVPQTHGQQRLRAVQGLDLRLLIDVQHHRLVGWFQVQTDDVADFLHEERIGRELEVLLPVGLHREGLQPAMNGGFGDPCCCSQGSGAPVGAAVGGRGLQCPVDHLGDGVVLVGARPARPQLVVQAFQTQFPVPLAPLTDGHARQAHALGDRCIGFASSAGQHDLGALYGRMRQGPRAGDALKLLNLALNEDQRWHRTTNSHRAHGDHPILTVISGTAH
jgi:hypothetical protein